MLPIIAVMNLIVGTLVGVSGIAGFLLPIVFTGYLGMDLSLSLALSFISFLTSGIIGSYRYQKQGQMDVRFGVLIGIGSIVGAVLGVKLNFMIPLTTAKLFLYLVVLASGLSILIKKEKGNEKAAAETREAGVSGMSGTSGNRTSKASSFASAVSPGPAVTGLLANKAFVLAFGFITGAICSLSGAGGPILVMPILVSLGMPVRIAVGVSLFDSIFIAIPACIGYLAGCTADGLLAMCLVSIICQGIGVFVGASLSGKINVKLLKKAVAVFSIGIALYMLAGLLL